MYRAILVPTDGSKGARRGAEYALRLAAEHDAELHTLFVVDERLYGATPALSSDELFLEWVESWADGLLDDIAAEAERQGVKVTKGCVRGDPCDSILEYAEENGIDYIVMGTHGNVPRGRPHLGGCTHRVSAQAQMPVASV